MVRKFRISVDGHAYDVVVEEILDDRGAHASALAPLAATLVAAAPAPRPAQRATAAGPGAELAPLAGVVVSIDVALGQQVGAGDRIAVIEAMKMKTDVFAKGAGAVGAIAVKPGDAVDAGDALLTLA